MRIIGLRYRLLSLARSTTSQRWIIRLLAIYLKKGLNRCEICIYILAVAYLFLYFSSVGCCPLLVIKEVRLILWTFQKSFYSGSTHPLRDPRLKVICGPISSKLEAVNSTG